MTLEELIDNARHLRRLSGPPPARNKLVKDWWPKPKIIALPKEQWGNRWQHPNSNCEHRFECFSFSHMGFHSGGYRGEQSEKGKPENICLAYGETPTQAYNSWCKIFEVWNKEEDWL